MKKQFVFLILTRLLNTVLFAQQKVIQLYDGSVPGSESWTWNEAENDINSWQAKIVAEPDHLRWTLLHKKK